MIVWYVILFGCGVVTGMYLMYRKSGKGKPTINLNTEMCVEFLRGKGYWVKLQAGHPKAWNDKK